ncbi:MAG: hypothetical protein AAB417_03240 [Patescibacteria group bacterium]
MKKIIFGTIIGLFAMASTASAAGLTQQQIDAILGLLRSFGAEASVVANAESSLTGGAPTTSPTAWCHTFNINLKVGDKGLETGHLIRALAKEGNSFSDYSTGENFGIAVFEDEVASAVVGFQEKYRSEILTPNGLSHGTGYVGSATRKKLNQLYGCASNNQNSELTGIIINVPQPNDSVALPVSVKGSINGNGWFGNEGEVGTVRVYDANNKPISNTEILVATSDWLKLPTSFEAMVGDRETMSYLETPTGYLKFSSEGEKDDDVGKKFIVPIRFK